MPRLDPGKQRSQPATIAQQVRQAPTTDITLEIEDPKMASSMGPGRLQRSRIRCSLTSQMSNVASLPNALRHEPLRLLTLKDSFSGCRLWVSGRARQFAHGLEQRCGIAHAPARRANGIKLRVEVLLRAHVFCR